MTFPGRIAIALSCLMSAGLALAGCQESSWPPSDTRIVITTGLWGDDLFRVEGEVCPKTEYLVYLYDMQATCEEGFTHRLFEGEEGAAIAAALKDNALAAASRTKAMVILAREKGVGLSAADEEMARRAAERYYESLSEEDLSLFGKDLKPTLEKVAKETLLAHNVYNYLIRDIDPEVSDDDARRVTVRQILLKTWEADEEGTRRAFTSEEREKVRERALRIVRDLRAGADFNEVSGKWNEGEETELSFGRGEVEAPLEEAAFSLSRGEVSSPIETSEGFVILLMVKTQDKQETTANKARIMDERRREAFDDDYDRFAKDLSSDLNEGLYRSIELAMDPPPAGFFDGLYDLMS